MKKIIFVEDNLSIQDAVSLVFRNSGYDITLFSNADPLLKNDIELPDVFILDRQLSGISGLDICTYLKNNEQTRNIPVIMLSANPDIGKFAQLAGADAALEKPFRMKDLKDLVAHFTS